MKRYSICFFCLLLASRVIAQPPKAAPTKLPIVLTESLAAHKGIVYARYGDLELQLDLYRPSDKRDPLPAVVCMTGELDDNSTHADDTRRDLLKLGIPSELIVIPQAPHAFLNQQKAFDIGLTACDAFLGRHLKN